VDVDRFRVADQPDHQWRAKLGAGEDLLVLYIGAHGISQGLSTVVEASALLGDAPIHVALVGEGADKPSVLERIQELAVQNLTSHPGVPRDEVQAVLSAGDICLVPLRDVPLFTTFIPSKIFELLAAGKVIVASVAGESADILREAGALVVAPEDPVALAAALRSLANDPARRREMSVQGRSYVEKSFDRRVLAARYEEVLDGVVGR
jgi:glycosyltransferase involved in cell wall biosynthesis